MKYSETQAKYYDKYPPVVPWPKLLLKSGLETPYRPKEIYWKKLLDGLNIKSSDKVLDVGCGQGLFLARVCKHYGCMGVGLDASSLSIKHAKNNYGNKNLRYFKGDALDIPFKDCSFDKVVSFDLLEHIKDKKRVLQGIVRVLKDDGSVIVHAVNKNDKYTLNWVWEKLGFDVYSRAMHERDLFVDVEAVEKDLKALGLKKTKIYFYDAFFTLGADELIIVIAVLLNKLGFENRHTVGNIYISVMNKISRFLYSLLMKLDKAWFEKGKSAGITVIAQKC